MNFSWENFQKKAENKKIVCYGAGVNAYLMLSKDVFIPYLDKILFFVDKDLKKNNTTLVSNGKVFSVKSLDSLNELDSDVIVLVTISDYISTGEMLDEKGLMWFPWTTISADFSFSYVQKQCEGSSKKYFLLNTPDYMNLGDHAITIAESKFLTETVGDFIEVGSNICNIEGLKKLHSLVKPDDVIFIQGGGNMGSLWRFCEENIRNIVELFRKNKIVIFPQSVYYENTEDALESFFKSKQCYDKHENLLICSRDRRSYEFVNKSYKCNSMLLPDVVLTMDYNCKSTRAGIGLILRDDKEKLISTDYTSEIESLVKELGMELKHITHHPVDDPSNRQKRIDELLDIYSSCELVITDRLHGMIFSVITNTPCIVFDNSYHKISDLYFTWLRDCDYVTLSEQVDKSRLAELIKQKLNYSYKEFSNEIFKYEFNKLTSYLQE